MDGTQVCTCGWYSSVHMWVLRCAHVGGTQVCTCVGGTQVCTCGWYSGVHMWVVFSCAHVWVVLRCAHVWVVLRCAHVGGTQVCTCGWYSGVHMWVVLRCAHVGGTQVCTCGWYSRWSTLQHPGSPVYLVKRVLCIALDYCPIWKGIIHGYHKPYMVIIAIYGHHCHIWLSLPQKLFYQESDWWDVGLVVQKIRKQGTVYRTC